MSAGLLTQPALELAALVRSGQLAASELVEASLRRIDELDPQIGAFTHVAHESALTDARAIRPGDERPFAGVPIAVKDNRAVAGMPLTFCSDIFGDFIPRRDTFAVRRLREAGFVIVGKTKMPEMGILPTTEPRRFGPARNPWDPNRTPGGSSGGSAAAVAAGMVPIAHGNDGGGSTRIPAACCGLVGLKPARGRVSPGPEAGQSFLTVDGVLTRTVADTVHALDVLAGYEPGDATWAPPPPRPYGELAAEVPGRLRIGLALRPPLDAAELDPVCRQATLDAAALLESLGHSVEETEPPWSGGDLLSDFTRVFGPHVSSGTAAGARLARRDPSPELVEPLTWAIWKGSTEQSAIAYVEALGRVQSVGRAVIAAVQRYDAVLTPALASRPVPIGHIHGQGADPWEFYARSGHFTPYTAVVNLTGQPAVSVPLYHGDDGLPTAVQLIAPPARDEVILRLAAQLEQALPWAGRLAPPARADG